MQLKANVVEQNTLNLNSSYNAYLNNKILSKKLLGQSSSQPQVEVDDLTEIIGQMNLESAENFAMPDANSESNQAVLPTDNVVEKENLLLSKGDFPSFMFQTIYVNCKNILVFSVRFLMF